VANYHLPLVQGKQHQPKSCHEKARPVRTFDLRLPARTGLLLIGQAVACDEPTGTTIVDSTRDEPPGLGKAMRRDHKPPIRFMGVPSFAAALPQHRSGEARQ